MDNRVLDYNGLKQLVKCVLAEIPQADGSTIIKNADGTLSAMDTSVPEVQETGTTGTLVFNATSNYVDDETEALVFK